MSTDIKRYRSILNESFGQDYQQPDQSEYCDVCGGEIWQDSVGQYHCDCDGIPYDDFNDPGGYSRYNESINFLLSLTKNKLLEDMGNLEKISPELRQVFIDAYSRNPHTKIAKDRREPTYGVKKYYSTYQATKDGQLNTASEIKKKGAAYDVDWWKDKDQKFQPETSISKRFLSIGPNSNLVDAAPKNSKTTVDTFLESDKIPGFVLKIGEEQVAIFVKVKKTDYKDDTVACVKISTEGGDMLKQGFDDGIITQKSALNHADKFLQPNGADSSKGQLSTVVGAFFKLVKNNPDLGKINLMLIFPDNDRLNKRKERSERLRSLPGYTGSMRGKDPYISHPSSSDFKTLALRSLRQRLDFYKENNAVSAESPEDFLRIVLEKGYLDKIKIGKATYELSNERISISDLKKGNNNSGSLLGGSYVEYRLDRFSDAFEKATSDMSREERMKFLETMPTLIKISFKLSGGTIVPSKVEIEKY